MTIQHIINNTLKRLKEEGKLLTPDFYAEAFCKEAARAKMKVEDCNHIDTFTNLLNPQMQKDLKNYRIRTMKEFVRFLVAKLNRLNPSSCSQILESETLLGKRVLQAITVLHNKEATELALKTMELIEIGAQPQQLDSIRQRWVNFLTTYDDTFLKNLENIEEGEVKDLIFALSSTMEGDTTNFYIYKQIQDYKVITSTISRGISVGDELEYADEVTLGRSIINRIPFEASLKM
jgi:predicted Zn-dependent protease